EVFAMPRPQAGESGASEVVVQGFKIGLDQYVLVALKSVQDGSLESFSEAERKAIEDILVQSGGAREYLLKSQLLHQQADIKRTYSVSPAQKRPPCAAFYFACDLPVSRDFPWSFRSVRFVYWLSLTPG